MSLDWGPEFPEVPKPKARRALAGRPCGKKTRGKKPRGKKTQTAEERAAGSLTLPSIPESP